MATTFNDLFARFSVVRKIKWPSFLQTEGYILLKRNSVISVDRVKMRIFLTYRIQNYIIGL